MSTPTAQQEEIQAFRAEFEHRGGGRDRSASTAGIE